eukprot:SAG31_NODE_31319_length_369_cov_1.144444_1_plen_58_part_10
MLHLPCLHPENISVSTAIIFWQVESKLAVLYFLPASTGKFLQNDFCGDDSPLGEPLSI